METSQTITRTKWTLDPSHSQIGFRVKHLMVTNVRGTFKDNNAEIFTTGNDFSNAEINLSIDASSVDTGDTTRDSHLKSPDFFDAENFKKINFKGISFEKINEGKYALAGDITIKGVTKRIQLDVEFNGIINDPYGNKRAGFEITGKISRKDFGLTWNAALEAGGVMVGDEVKINCEIQLIQQIES
jgi:polyisoprenoid-binding protein YceI